MIGIRSGRQLDPAISGQFQSPNFRDGTFFVLLAACFGGAVYAAYSTSESPAGHNDSEDEGVLSFPVLNDQGEIISFGSCSI